MTLNENSHATAAAPLRFEVAGPGKIIYTTITARKSLMSYKDIRRGDNVRQDRMRMQPLRFVRMQALRLPPIPSALAEARRPLCAFESLKFL